MNNPLVKMMSLFGQRGGAADTGMRGMAQPRSPMPFGAGQGGFPHAARPPMQLNHLQRGPVADFGMKGGQQPGFAMRQPQQPVANFGMRQGGNPVADLAMRQPQQPSPNFAMRNAAMSPDINQLLSMFMGGGMASPNARARFNPFTYGQTGGERIFRNEKGVPISVSGRIGSGKLAKAPKKKDKPKKKKEETEQDKLDEFSRRRGETGTR